MLFLDKFLEILANFKPSEHIHEFGALCLIALYVTWFFWGKKRNLLLARTWLQNVRSLMQSQFALIGDGEGHSLFKESYDEYVFYATGRKHCQSLYANLQLKPRHDLFQTIAGLFVVKHDLLVIETILDESVTNSFIFALVSQKKEKLYRKERYDLGYFTKTLDARPISGNKVIMTDCPELVDVLLSKSVINLLKETDDLFEEFIVTDQHEIKPSRITDKKANKRIQFVFRLPSIEDMGRLIKLHEFIFSLVDTTGEAINLKGEVENRLSKMRRQTQEDLERLGRIEKQEAAQKRKVEKLRKERDELNQKSPEAQRKWEAKEYKKNLKKRMGGLRSKVVR